MRTIRIFHHFTDKSALNVQIRPHYYTGISRVFRNRFFSPKSIFSGFLSSNFFIKFFRIFVKSRNLKKSGFPSERSHHFPVLLAWQLTYRYPSMPLYLTVFLRFYQGSEAENGTAYIPYKCYKNCSL